MLARLVPGVVAAVVVVGCSASPPPAVSADQQIDQATQQPDLSVRRAEIVAGQSVEAMQELMFADKDELDLLVDQIFVADSPAATTILHELNAARFSLAPETRTSDGLRYVVSALSVTSPTVNQDGSAVVDVWAVHIVSRQTVIDPQAQYEMHTLTLRREGSGWKVWDWEQESGPVPQPTGIPVTADELATWLSGHMSWRSTL